MPRIPTPLLHAVRQLRFAPGFTVSSIVILAVGIGISTAVFTTVDHVLFQPIQLPDAERLITLCEVHAGERQYCTASPANVMDWQAQARALEAAGVARRRGVSVEDEGKGGWINAAAATPGFLSALGVRPLHGRLLLAEDGPPAGHGRVMVISHELWQGRFGGDANIIGATFRGSSEGDGAKWYDAPVTIVGVLPPGVRVPRFEDVEAWIPFQLDPRAEEHRDWRGFVALGRLQEGSTIASAQAELNGIQLQLAAAYPDAVRNWTVEVFGARDWIVRDVRPLLLLFLAAVMLVLLMVCVNVMSLLFARATQRQREFSVRVALGAGRGRLLQQLLLEGALVAGAGAVAGMLLAVWLLDALIALAPAGVPRLDEIALDTRALLFAIGVTTAMTLVCGLAPLLRLRGMQLEEGLRIHAAGGADRRGNRLRNGLVVMQIALTLTLVLSTGLLLRSFSRQAAFDPGFDMAGLLTFQVFPPMERYDSRERVALFYVELERRLDALPGVIGVGTTSSAPFLGGGDGHTPFLIAGREAVPVQDAPTAAWFDAGPGFFPTLGVRILEGRNLAEDDAVATAVINRTMARLHWPGTSPLGAIVLLPQLGLEVEIVGVADDMRTLDEPVSTPGIFISNRQSPRWASFFVVRTAVPPGSVAESVRSAIAQLDPEIEPRSLATMEERLESRLVAPRFNVLVVGVFSVLALLLTVYGLHALIAYNVTVRMREFGIRMALGAGRRHVLRCVLWQGVRLLGAGIALGVLGALYFGRMLRTLLFGVGPTDPWAIAGTVLLLAAGFVAASAAPAVRAGRLPPTMVMRAE